MFRKSVAECPDCGHIGKPTPSTEKGLKSRYSSIKAIVKLNRSKNAKHF